MGGIKRKGKSMATLKKLTELLSPPLEIERKKKVKVVIDKDFVNKYMADQTAVAAAPIEIDSSLDEAAATAPTIEISSSDDENDDVIFVKHIKPPEFSPKTQITAMQKEISDLRRENRNLNQRFVNMQSAISNGQLTQNQNQNAASTEQNASLILSEGDEQWLNNEIKLLMDNGQMHSALSDLINENDN